MSTHAKLASAAGLHLAEAVTRLPPPPSFWPNYVKRTYQELGDHLTGRKDSKGLELLDALMDVAVQKAKYGSASLVVRMDALSDYFDKSKDTAANMMVERLVEGIDGLIENLSDDNNDDDDDDWRSEDD